MNEILFELSRIIRFGIVGLTASVLHLLAAMFTLNHWPEMHESVANAIAYVIAFMISLLGHQKITFQRKARLSKFLLLSWIGLAINYSVLFFGLWLGLSDLFVIVPAVGVAALASYLLASRWVFSEGLEKTKGSLSK
ncbi:MAG: GtrA family protein [Neptuniibacter sp.]